MQHTARKSVEMIDADVNCSTPIHHMESENSNNLQSSQQAAAKRACVKRIRNKNVRQTTVSVNQPKAVS